MSKTLSGFLTGVAFGAEGTMGVEAATYPYLWDAQETDGLDLGESPYDVRALRGARGQVGAGHRVMQQLPGGSLPAMPIAIGTAGAKPLVLLQAHLQGLAVAGATAPYTYTGTPATAAIEDDEWFTLSVIKETGVDNHAHRFLGCVIDELEIAWEAGGPITIAPTALKAMSGDADGTMPTFPTPSSDGYLQAPRIACLWNGTEIHPASWTITSKCNIADRQSGSARGRIGFVMGDYDGAVEVEVWRNEDSDTNWVGPFYDGAIGTLSIAAYPATVTLAGGQPPTFTYLGYFKVELPSNLNTNNSDLKDTVTLRCMADTSLPVFSLTQESGTLLD
ncbi:MAG: hypothetical protein WC088_06755 [Candidatus Izemoplasmatales bacterium]